MKSFIAALCVLATGTVAGFALDGPGRRLVISDPELQASNDAELVGAVGDGVQRSFIPPYSGVVRVQWEVRSGNGTQVNNSVDVIHLSSCERPTMSTAYVVKVCNIRVKDGMPFTVSATPTDGSNTVSVRNVRVYYRVVNSNGEAIPYVAPVQF